MSAPDPMPADARALLDAVVAISSDLDLHTVLRRIIESSCALTGARYGALGVIGHNGELSDFVTHGMSEDEHAAIGDLPRGHGILGLLIRHPAPLRLAHLGDHPQASGFPANHPPMDAFLGVPIRVRGKVFGNLYLTEKAGGAEFTDADEALVLALADAAGFVVGNARAYARSEQRRKLLEAVAQVAEALEPPVQLEEALSQIVLGARRVSDARAAAVVHLLDSSYEISASGGPAVDLLPGILSELDEQVRSAERADGVVVHPDGVDDTVVLVSLRAHLATRGVLVILLAGGRGSVDPEELDLLASFGDQASLALDRAQAMIDRRELLLTADRERIARDLHDVVIQRLFATGLGLQGTRRRIDDEEVAERLDQAVADLDTTIRDIRSSIFELQHTDDVSLRADIRALVREYTPLLGFTPIVRTSGPIDFTVSPTSSAHVVAVLREALSNVARHARATSCVVEVEADERWIRVRVTDDGVGLAPDRVESGLDNARRRASGIGGTLELRPAEPNGTSLEWRAPVQA